MGNVLIFLLVFVSFRAVTDPTYDTEAVFKGLGVLGGVTTQAIQADNVRKSITSVDDGIRASEYVAPKTTTKVMVHDGAKRIDPIKQKYIYIKQ